MRVHRTNTLIFQLTLYFAIILAVVTMILNFANGVNATSILDGIVGIVFSATSFACAKTIRNSL